MKVEAPAIPLFDEYSIDELVVRLDGVYSRAYLDDLKAGRQHIRPRFRAVVCRLLQRSERDLFGETA